MENQCALRAYRQAVQLDEPFEHVAIKPLADVDKGGCCNSPEILLFRVKGYFFL
ncbi:hypothetical protein [Maridesulfovibrio sp.]|uniref:hypothetical protein n=1 Tax=Maridesulfovibrio sp. TaxID=2795000 RepID=UPI002A18BE3A|nr:hypothetical protein [Maridesulfovibrio sp.]